MSDENAEKAWEAYPSSSHVKADEYDAFMAGRASRDAEVESLRANWENECGNLEMAEREVESLRQQLAEAEQTMVELKPDPVLVEGSWFEVDDLPTILGNFMRSNAEYARVAKVTWIQVNSLQQQLAERDAVIKRVRAYADQVDPAHLDEQPIWPTSVRNILDTAPSSTLDALIRQKQAEALEAAADLVDSCIARPVGMNSTEQQYFRPWHSKWLRDRAADHRNGADHE